LSVKNRSVDARRPASQDSPGIAWLSNLLGKSRVNASHTVLSLTVACCLCCATASFAAEPSGPLSPADSLKQIVVEPGLAVELVACEPEVIDPIAIRFDEDGRLWVVEMRDYPHGPPAGQPPLSKIRVLTDADGDGRYETSRVFAEEMLFPTGIQPWQGGLFVTLAGEVLYLKDTDGDGRADTREVWYRGFTAENPQLRANHPRLGLDGRIYVSNGLRGGEVENVRSGNPDQPRLNISGRDFSFDPRSGDCEAVSGNGQFGLAFDDFGNHFTCNNRAPLQQVVLESRYLARNPFLAATSVVRDVATPGEASRVFPLVAAWTTSNLHAGQFTAACGVEIYRGDLLGDVYYGNAFTCEPTGSLVHREIISPDGATLTARPALENKEFLASRDPWFRGVNLENGPDGALYVVDMYRAVIEHPQFMPTELQTRPDLHLGNDRGRIYRIVRADKKMQRLTPKLSAATSAELVAMLDHAGGWWRDTAARLLVERQDKSVQAPLEQLAGASRRPASRVAALWALENLGQLSPDTIARALADSAPTVRAQGVLLAESRLASNETLRAGVHKLATDADPTVRFRVALALGGLDDDAIEPDLARIALTAADDIWTRTAVATALPRHTAGVLAAVLGSISDNLQNHDAPPTALIAELATIVGASRDPAAVARVLSLATDESNRSATARETALLGLAQGLERRGASMTEVVAGLVHAQSLAARLDVLFARVIREAADVDLDESVRAGKLDLLRYDRSPRAVEALLPIVTQSPSQTLRISAAAALTAHSDPRIGPDLVAAYAAQTPAVRRAILDALIAEPGRANLLLDQVAAGHIAKSELDAPRQNRLKSASDPALRLHAAELLAAAPPAERKRVLADYQASLKLKANPQTGRELFRQHCSVCHRIAGVGVDVAPDISDSRVKTPEQLLVDILNPNQAIDNNYTSYTVVMADGSIHSGIIGGETASAITLRQQEAKTVELLRADVETIKSTGLSLMPEGFEKQLSQQQLADLISFIKNWRYLTTNPRPQAGEGGSQSEPGEGRSAS